ncbi:MAG TPA: hypothetical protein VFS15_20655 [Kofleriaceae bacterium]|nr:hypothetical protein [Kofleriaceae bacterium]
MSWRNLSIILALLCTYQAWRGCNRRPPAADDTAAAECTPDSPRRFTSSSSTESRTHEAAAPSSDDSEPPPDSPGLKIGGFKVPAWAMWLAPQPGENLLDYRDRIVPIAQAAIAPQRARVARGRDDFARIANLDSQQRAQLDATVQQAQTEIQDKVMGSLMSGDLMPANFKPMTGVALARDVLDVVDHANQRFISTLREDQKEALAHHPFDFADYLLFSARWEDALGVTN